MVLHFRKATGIFIETLPWVLVRFAVGLAFTALAVAYFVAIAFLLFTLAGISGGIALVGLLVAGIVFYGFFRLLRRYVLYLVTAGLVAGDQRRALRKKTDLIRSSLLAPRSISRTPWD